MRTALSDVYFKRASPRSFHNDQNFEGVALRLHLPGSLVIDICEIHYSLNIDSHYTDQMYMQCGPVTIINPRSCGLSVRGPDRSPPPETCSHVSCHPGNKRARTSHYNLARFCSKPFQYPSLVLSYSHQKSCRMTRSLDNIALLTPVL